MRGKHGFKLALDSRTPKFKIIIIKTKYKIQSFKC